MRTVAISQNHWYNKWQVHPGDDPATVLAHVRSIELISCAPWYLDETIGKLRALIVGFTAKVNPHEHLIANKQYRELLFVHNLHRPFRFADTFEEFKGCEVVVFDGNFIRAYGTEFPRVNLTIKRRIINLLRWCGLKIRPKPPVGFKAKHYIPRR